MGLLNITQKVLLAFTACLLPSLSFAQAEDDVDYERSSIHVMMIKHLNQKFDDIIEEVFLSSPFPDRFNDHNLGVKVVSFAEHKEDQNNNILSFIDQVNLGQKMVAKWFNRDKASGSFNMELVKERGFYNATQKDINIARASIRGKALLEDAGENLIKNTYLLINDISYNSKGSRNSFLKSMASALTGNANKLGEAISGIGGFKVRITSYLYRLDWNDEIANEFYTKYYTENGSADADKVKGFKAERELFKMIFVGKTTSESSETHFKKSKDPAALLVKVTTRTIDQNIADLQNSYTDFRIKAPLVGTEPLRAHVGLKENITEDSKFEVLERVITEDGKVVYVRVGIIRPKKGMIMDNRYLAFEDNPDGITATEFEKVSGKDFYVGMLIREIND